MKKIVDGKLYDTATAEAVHTYDNGLAVDDLGYVEQTLHRTAAGRYFIEGQGGPLSLYGVERGRTTSSGAGIDPVDEARALEWLESHGAAADLIAKYFSVAEA